MPRQVYKDASGMRLPGVTTITAELGWSKQVLIKWANKLGLQGIDVSKFVDDKADIGTLAHQMVMDHLMNQKSDMKDYSANQISLAENCLLSYYAWEKGKTIKPIMLETPLVSEVHKFGGCLDGYVELDGKKTLFDLKTGKDVYAEHKIQVAGGYLVLLEEAGHKVEQVIILSIPRAEDESFHSVSVPEDLWPVCKGIFFNCLNNYKLHKLLTKEE